MGIYKSVLFVAGLLCVAAPCAVLARDFTECTPPAELVYQYGYILNDGCVTGDTVASCCAIFGLGDDCAWQGSASYWTYRTNCYLDVPAGMSADVDFLFDEDRYSELFHPCPDWGYCTGGEFTYDEVKTTEASLDMFATVCPVPDNIYLDSARTKLVQQYNHVLAPEGSTSEADCYLVSGTYYDALGAFMIVDSPICNF